MASSVATKRKLSDFETSYKRIEAVPKKRVKRSAAKKGIFRFEDLPAELRLNIYEYALVASDTINISRHQDMKSQKKALAAWNTRRAGRHMVSGYPRPKPGHYLAAQVLQDPQRLSMRKATGISLLRVSKGINTEAKPVLYGRACFRFNHPRIFTHFADMIVESCQLLANVEIFSFDPHGIVGYRLDQDFSSMAFTRLWNVPKLERLQLSGWAKSDDLDDLVGQVSQLCVGLCQDHSAECATHNLGIEACSCARRDEIAKHLLPVLFQPEYGNIDFVDGVGPVRQLTDGHQVRIKAAVADANTWS